MICAVLAIIKFILNWLVHFIFNIVFIVWYGCTCDKSKCEKSLLIIRVIIFLYTKGTTFRLQSLCRSLVLWAVLRLMSKSSSGFWSAQSPDVSYSERKTNERERGGEARRRHGQTGKGIAGLKPTINTERWGSFRGERGSCDRKKEGEGTANFDRPALASSSGREPGWVRVNVGEC